MPAAKALVDHVRDRSFRSRRHHNLLAGPVVPWPELATIQARYAGATHELERRAIGVDFEHAVRELAGDVALVDDIALAEFEAFMAQGPSVVDVAARRRATDREASANRSRDLRADGLSWPEIGDRLGLTAATVRRRVTALERRYGYEFKTVKRRRRKRQPERPPKPAPGPRPRPGPEE